MAYVPSYVDDEEQKKKDAQLTTETTTPATGATETATTSGASSPLAQQGFVGIGQYLNANKDQAQGLADKLTAPIDQEVKSAQDSQTKYTTDLQANNAKAGSDWQTNQNTAQAAANKDHQTQLNDAYYLWQRTPENIAPSNQAVLGTGTSGPNSLKAEREKAYQDLLANPSVADTGPAPTPLAFTPDTSVAQKASGDLTALGTMEGRQALLQGLAAPGYTAGENQFDAALLGTTGIASAGSKYEGILNALRNPVAPAATTPAPGKTVSAIPGAIADKQAAKAFAERNAVETAQYQADQKAKMKAADLFHLGMFQ